MSDRQRENSLLVAYNNAADILRNSATDAICKKTGAFYLDGNYNIRFIDKNYRINMPEVDFGKSKIPDIVKVLILHYLTFSNKFPVNGEYISFNGIPGGMFYYKSFQKRAPDKLLMAFKDQPSKLEIAGASLGGKKWFAGDFSVIIPVFPKIDMIFQIFTADEELPAEAGILFPDSIVNFLPTEDTAFLGGYLTALLSTAAQ